MIKYNAVNAQLPNSAAPSTQAVNTAAIAAIANTVARPGPLTTEWWTMLLGGGVSALLAQVHLPGGTAAQVSAIAAPVIVSLVYAFVRSHTKGALADILKELFPQAAANAALDQAALTETAQPLEGDAPSGDGADAVKTT